MQLPPLHTLSIDSLHWTLEGDLVVDYWSALDSQSDLRVRSMPDPGLDLPSPAKAAKRRRAQTSADSGWLDTAKEKRAMLAWMKMCSANAVPSTPLADIVNLSKTTRYIRASMPADIRAAVAATTGMQSIASQALAAANRSTADRAYPVHKQVSSSTDTDPGYDQDYVFNGRTSSAFSALSLLAENTHADHVIPRVVLRALFSVSRFGCAVNDPVNIVRVRASENQHKGSKAIWFGFFKYPTVSYYNPDVFPLENKAAMARVVMYMFLTYPLVSDARSAMATGAPSGMAAYARQLDTLLWLNQASAPSKDELTTAWKIFYATGWCNPLVCSWTLTTGWLQDGTHPMRALLNHRMHGTDAGSNAIMQYMKQRGVLFREELRV
jgi:hypothetical protein